MKKIRQVLSFWELFISLGAVFGAAMMFYDPTGVAFGMDGMLPDIQNLPFSNLLFRDFVFCGVALLLVNGVTNVVAYVMLRRRSRYAGAAGMVCGVILMFWICVQFIIFPLNIPSTAYFIFGAAQAYTGYRYICYDRGQSDQC